MPVLLYRGYGMHTVLLSFPGVDNEKQMLCYLSDIQLGLPYDVFAPYFYQKLLHLKSAWYFTRSCYRVGDPKSSLSRTFS